MKKIKETKKNSKKEVLEPIKIKLVEREGSISVIAKESVYYAKNIKCTRLKGKIYTYR